MKTITTTAIVALMTASVVLTAVAPTYAQSSAAPSTQADAKPGQPFSYRGNHGGRFGGGDMLNFARGAEGVEIALVRLSHAIEMTADQQKLFDTFKTDALAAATSFATATEALRPAAPAAGETPALPDMSARLKDSIALQQARLAALEAVQPSATAFFDSLTDEQKTQLMPQRPDRVGDRDGRGDFRRFGKGGDHRGGDHRQGGPRQAPTEAPTAPAAPATNG